METKELHDGLILTTADDMEYSIAYHKNGTVSSGVAVKGNGLVLMALATATVANVLEKLHDPYLQAVFFRSMFDTVKEADVLDPLVDMAVSYNGIVLQSSNKKADDYWH